jgi:Clostripain family
MAWAQTNSERVDAQINQNFIMETKEYRRSSLYVPEMSVLEEYRSTHHATPQLSKRRTTQRRLTPQVDVMEPRVVPSGYHPLHKVRDAGATPAIIAPAAAPASALSQLENVVTSAQENTGTWTVMVYLNGDNLNKEIYQNIVQMEQVATGAPQSVHIVVLYSQPTLLDGEHPVIPTGGGNQIWEAPDTTGVALLKPRPADASGDTVYTNFTLERSNIGSGQTLENFIETAEKDYPAQYYALIFGGHGGGISGFNPDQNFQTIDPKNFELTTTKLVSALAGAEAADGDSVSLLAFDECLMAATEVEYAVRGLVPYVVASEEEVAGNGFNYENALAPLTNTQAVVTPVGLAQSMVSSFQNEYVGKSDADTLSAVQTSALGALATSLHRFVNATATATQADWAELRRARADATKYSSAAKSAPFRDLGQFLDAAARYVPSAAIRSTAQAADTALEQAVVYQTTDRRGSTGLSIVLPTGGEQAPKDYARQAAGFLQASGWLTFLRRFATVGGGPEFSDPVDWAENNDSEKTATGLGTVAGRGLVIPDLTLPRGDVDWYSFSLSTVGGPDDNVKLAGDVPPAAVQLQLFSGDTLLRQGQSSVSLADLPAGTYDLRVAHGAVETSFPYSLTINAPGNGTFQAPADNDLATATDLGTVFGAGLASYGNNVEFSRADDAPSWFEFTTPESTAPFSGSIRVIAASAPHLTVTIYNQQGKPIAQGAGRRSVTVSYRASGAGEPYYFTVAGGTGSYDAFFSNLT